MKNIKSFLPVFLPENVRFLEVKFSIYLNRRVFVMVRLSLYQEPLVVSVSVHSLQIFTAKLVL